ncbi:MAG: ATP-dependent helicase HrpB [Nitrospirae bacterium]|nr:ATP-dependent helicase HrpB [Nitrospirota bacterium]
MKSYPVDEIIPELRQAILGSKSVVLQAPPGAGKTTRVPLALLDIIPPEKGRIIMLEPRRIAAVSAARWMARIRGEETGGTVGYTIRFERKVSSSTRIEVVTEGVLTRRMQTDPGLEGVAAVIFDEFHERSLHADLSLAICLDIQRNLREDLKVIVMSATVDPGPVASLLGNVPVITSHGRAFPVEEHYLEDKHDRRLSDRVFEAVRLALNKTLGDILVFLPGTGDIRACTEALKPVAGHGNDRAVICPLYGDLTFEQQEQAILPSDKRKIVLSTNIAETSLTIEGVGVVIDSGLTRAQRYDPSTGMNRLVTTGVSRASAEQRKGRAGRLGPGVCYRLYSRHTLQSMVPFTPAEIMTSDLSPFLLQLLVWGVNDPYSLSWLDPPPEAALNSARQLLVDLGAIDQKGSPTEEGKAMARLPLHPRLGRLMVRARELSFPRLGADLSALISERDILLRGPNYQARAVDVMERLEILRAWRGNRRDAAGVDLWALRAVERTSRQLSDILRSERAGTEAETDQSEIISRLLLCAFPDRVARMRPEGDGRYLLSSGRGARFPRGSGISGPRYVVAVNVDAGEKAEGAIHLASSVTVELVREECKNNITIRRRVEWDKRENRIAGIEEETLGAVVLSSRPLSPTDEEAILIICDRIRSAADVLKFTKEARQFQGRVAVMKGAFPEEDWPDLTDERLISTPETWLAPWLKGIRKSGDIDSLDLLPALEAQLTWKQSRALNELVPTHMNVPSGSRIAIDYCSGEVPVLAVKLQEMFGLAETPSVAGGRVKLLLQLLSPARRPVQITQDLRGFWDGGYQQVKKELKGRYPKHPWPDDPWNASPTRKTKGR